MGGYCITYAPAHLASCHKRKEFRQLLLDSAWIKAKLQVSGVAGVLADYDLAQELFLPRSSQQLVSETVNPDSEMRPLELIQSALRLSAHVISKDPEQLAPQMVGRLLQYEGIVEIKEFITELKQASKSGQLIPVNRSLTSPGRGEVRTFTGHSRSITAIAVTSDGKLMVSSSRDSSIIVWDLKSGSELCRFSTTNPALDVVVSGTGIVAVACEDGAIRLFDIDKREQSGTLTGHESEVSALLVTSSGQVISGSHDRTLRIWNLPNKECEKVLTGHLSPIMDIAFAGPNRLASLDASELRIWDIELGEPTQSIPGRYGVLSEADCTKLALTPDGSTAIASLGHDGVAIADLRSGTITDNFDRGPQWINSLAMFQDGQRAVVGFASLSNKFGILSWHDGFAVNGIADSHSRALTTVTLTPDEKHILTGSADCTIKLWQSEYLTAKSSDTGPHAQPDPGESARHFLAVNSIVSVGDTEYFFSGGQDYDAKLWSARTGELVRDMTVDSMFRAPMGGVRAAIATPDGGVVIAGSARGRVRGWRTDSGDEEFDWSLKGEIKCLVTCPSGKWLVGAFETNQADGTCLLVRNLKAEQKGIVYALETNQVPENRQFKSQVQALAWIPQLNGVVFVTDAGEVGVGNISTKSRFSLTDKRVGTTNRLTTKVVSVADDRVFLLVDGCEIWTISFSEKQPFTERIWRDPEITIAAYDADNSRCFLGKRDGRLTSVNMKTGQLSGPIAAHANRVNAIVAGPDGVIITCSDDQTVKCWDSANWKEIARFRGESEIRNAAYSRRWSVIAAGEASGKVHILHSDRS